MKYRIVDGKIKNLYEKICKGCGVSFETTTQCKLFCSPKCYDAWYLKENRARKRYHGTRTARRQRERLLEYLGGKCAGCGNPDVKVLRLHYIHGKGSKDFQKKGIRPVYTEILAGQREGEFDLRCANCQ